MATQAAMLQAAMKYDAMGYDVTGIIADVLHLDAVEIRMDKPCGKSHISDRKKCSPDKLKTLTTDLKAGDEGAKRRVAEGKKSAERKQQLNRAVQRDKGKRPVEIEPKASIPEGLNFSNKPTGKPGHISVTAYRNKGVSGYLAKLEHKENGEIDRQFQNSTSADPETYRGKMGQQHYDISKLKDGIYEAESKTGGYNTRNVDKYHFEVKSGKVVRHFEGLKDAKKNGLKIEPVSKGLPALEGSEKQVAWANTIREKAIAEAHKRIHLQVPEASQPRMKKHVAAVAAEKTSAKHWIDNRDNAATPLLTEAQNRARKELQEARG